MSVPSGNSFVFLPLSSEAYMKFLVKECERARSDGKIQIKEASASLIS